MKIQNHFLKVFEADQWAFSQLVDNLKLHENSGDAEPRKLAYHILMAYDLWYRRILGGDLSGLKMGGDMPLNEIEQYAHSVYDKWTEAMREGKIEDFEKVISYTDLMGNQQSNSIEDVIIQITHHSAYHRGQIQTRLKQAGVAPVKNDLIVYYRMAKASGNQ